MSRSPSTANDDQPGPIGRRHNSIGGDFDQSVSIRTPRTMPSRLGPRKPGQSGSLLGAARTAVEVPAAAGAGLAAFGWPTAVTEGSSFENFAAVGGGGAGGGASVGLRG